MTFRKLIELLSKRIGQHQLPVNAAASELRGFIDSGAVHYELVTQVITALYTGNHCRRLQDTVTRDASFAAIEPIRLTLLRSPKTDVDAYALMEDLCAEMATLFNSKRPASTDSAMQATGGRLYAFRRRLRFS